MTNIVATSYKPVKFLRTLFRELEVPYFAKTHKYAGHKDVLNFGSTNPVVLTTNYYWNPPMSVKIACDKLHTCLLLKQATIPTFQFTDKYEEAKQWLENGIALVGRKLLSSHSGKGIVIMRNLEEFEECKLYTQLIENGREFRVHTVASDVSFGVSLIQQKRRENGFTGNDLIRTRANGWVFCVTSPFLDNKPELKHQIVDAAHRAIDALSLDYGAVDILVKQGKLYVIEVNTAPALKATSVQQFYRDLFTGIVNGEVTLCTG